MAQAIDPQGASTSFTVIGHLITLREAEETTGERVYLSYPEGSVGETQSLRKIIAQGGLA